MVPHKTLKTETFCYPGAQVLHINSTLPKLLCQNHSSYVLLTYVESNDIKLQQSGNMKLYFKSLFDAVLKIGMRYVTKDPLPSPRLGEFWNCFIKGK